MSRFHSAPLHSVQGYPKKLAYEYLEELQNEFGRLYSGQVDAAARPYAFIKFGGLQTLSQYLESIML